MSRQQNTRQSLRALMPATLAAKISSTAGEMRGERREVTVLFLDVSNFTAASHSMDSEDVYLMIDQALRLLVEVVYAYEGTVDKFTGDGLMALFGAPIAHENDPERAVRAALEMQVVLRPLQERVQKQYGFKFQVRVGIHAGLVVAGEVGNDLHMEYTAIGDTVNLAARLQTAAQPGTILTSFSVYQRTRPLVQFQSLPSLSLKGMPEPIQVFQAIRLLERPGRVRGLPGLQVPMIGRDSALTRLQESLSDVCAQGHSRIVLLTGEAGLGKSRLLVEFRERVLHSSKPALVRIYEGGCLAYARSSPLWVVAQLLRHMIGLSETDPLEIQSQTIKAYLEKLGLTEGAFPYLAHVLGIPQADPAVEARLRLLDPPMLQRQSHDSLRQVFVASARLTPTVIILEDLHWVDPASRDFLEYLIQAIEDVPILLILVSRDAERKTVIRPLIDIAGRNPDRLLDIQLRPLSESEANLLVDRLLVRTAAGTESIKALIARRAEGNPFYAEEIVRMLIDEGGLIEMHGRWQLTPQAHSLLQEVPGTLKGLILARFDRLSEDLRRTLQKAAVLGRSFPVELLQMIDGEAPERIAANIEELENRHFLIAQSFGLKPGYTFDHNLVQEAVYSTLLKRDRQKIHGEVAQVLEGIPSLLPDEKMELLAYHYAESSRPSQALPYLIAAAENAARRSANETAIQRYRRALALLPTGSDSYGEQFFHTSIGLGRSLKFAGEFAEASQVLCDALQKLLHWSLVIESDSVLPPILVDALRELAEVRHREGAYDEAISHLQAALQALGAVGALERPDLWRSLLDRMAWVRFRQGKLDEAFTLATSATIDLGRDHSDDPLTLASLYNTMGGILWQRGNLSGAIRYVEQSLSLYQKVDYAWGMAIAYTNLGTLYYVRGMWPKAAESFEKAEALRREHGYLPELALTLNNSGLLRMAMGDHAGAQMDFEASLSISQRLGDEFCVVCSQIGLSRLAIMHSRFEEAADHLASAEKKLHAAGQDQAVQIQLLWSPIREARGDIEAALRSASQALEMAQAAQLGEEESDCRRILGALLMRAGRWQEAEAQLLESAAVCLRGQDAYRQGQALYELGRLYEQWGQADTAVQTERQSQAQSAYQQAAELFETLGAGYDLQMVQTALYQVQFRILPQGMGGRQAVANGRVFSSPSTSAAQDGEWHTVAVIWLNLTASQQADDEGVFESLAEIIPPLISIAQAQDGQVIERYGGLTMVFGAPAAHENDAERAVLAAWHMHHSVHEVANRTGAALKATLAVSFGSAIVGSMPNSLRSEFVVKGEPVKLAQRIAEVAPPDRVWVTAEVRKMTERSFVYDTVVEPILPGLPASGTFELIGVRDRPQIGRGIPGRRTRFIGRETALHAMAQAADNLRYGTGGLIYIEGDAGIGKSRLMREFANSVVGTGAQIWSGQCSPQRPSQAFSLFSHLLAQIFGLQTTDSPEQIAAKIGQVVQNWPAAAQTTRPYLEILCGVRPTGEDGSRLINLDPEQLRQQVFVALRHLLKSMTAEHPLILLLDDVHWIDSISADLLLFLSNMVTSLPVLFVCAGRIGEVKTVTERLTKLQSIHPECTIRLFLDRLPRHESEALLSELLLQAELPTPVRSVILEQGDGNPYYIEEYVRMLIEQGYLTHSQDGWEVDPGLELKQLPLPASLEALIRSRVDALPTELKAALQCAAVIGTTFEVDLLKFVAGQTNVQDALAQLEARGILRQAAELDLWQISHPLIQAVVYNSLLRTRRKSLHLKVAQALEARWLGAREEHAEELAYHYAQTDEGYRALKYLVLAGERAMARSSNEAAREYLIQAAELLSSQPKATDDLRWRIAAGLGDVYRFEGEYDQSIAALKAGLVLVETGKLSDIRRAGLYRRLGETTRLKAEYEVARKYFITALTCLGQGNSNEAQIEAARIMTGITWTHFQQGHFDQARESCEVGLEYARSASSLNELATAENLLGGIHYQLGQWEQALDHTRRAMALWEQMGYTQGVAKGSSNLGILAVGSGDWSKAESFFQRSLMLRQAMGDVEGMVIVHNNLGLLARDRGDFEQAESHFRESVAIATRMKIGYEAANSAIELAHVLVLRGEISTAQEMLTASLAQVETIRARDLLSEVYRVQAEILLAESNWEDAGVAAERSAQLAIETGHRSLESVAWRLASAAAIKQGDNAAARDFLERAWRAVADVIGELEAGRVAAQAGYLELDENNLAQAESHLQHAREIFQRLGAQFDLQHVNIGLSELRQRATVAGIAIRRTARENSGHNP